VDLSQQILQTKAQVTSNTVGDGSVQKPSASSANVTDVKDILHGLVEASAMNGAATMARISQMAQESPQWHVLDKKWKQSTIP
jgi:hypothetical protein